MKNFKVYFCGFCLGLGASAGFSAAWAEDHAVNSEEVDLLIDRESDGPPDVEVEEETTENVALKDEAAPSEVNLSEMAEEDDLQSLRADVGDFQDVDLFEKDLVIKDNKISLRPEKETPSAVPQGSSQPGARGKVTPNEEVSPQIFNVGVEEKKLLELAKFVEGRLPESEWDELAAKARVDHYTVQKGDWLWKISQKLFGSGFYYAKIWSLNPYIKNPHIIEPGMNLIFDTGNMDELPKVKLGEFYNNERVGGKSSDGQGINFDAFGDETEPPWLKERQQLINQGVYFQYASEETYEDLEKLSAYYSSREWDKYTPPMAEIIIQDPGEQYDRTGLDVNSKIAFDFKEGFFLNTFVTSNVVQDFGEIDSIASEHYFIYSHETIFVRFDDYLKVKPGDKFSIYSAEGKVENEVSERSGYRYTNS
ncbi:MAG: LysM peptidoglycan-binding domain-containing protein, partial [Bacteriovoracaceae bacterium]|nr:LysM peptidoglycan-binding domain-containing protein [Bacteriovoracaceae bacterium]